jgi:prepilin-type N-terminal cleavage/methylation domain-containing protein
MHITAHSKKIMRHGFTLLEMSIVLGIIALIVGGILIGKNLIRDSEIRAMISEYDSQVKAIREFQDKYQALPGDYSSAEANWGAATCPYADSVGSTTATCNGDGNGRIGASTTAGVLSAASEWFLVWQHLTFAGFANGRYTGTYGAGGTSDAVVGSNVPASKLSPGGWTVLYYLQIATDVNLWGDNYGHIMTFGGNSTNSYTSAAILTPNDTQTTDAKIDDGMPGTGKMRSRRTAVYANCTMTDSSQTTAVYNNTTTSLTACAPFFIPGF